MGPRWKSGSRSTESDLHTSGESEFRIPLDEGSGIVRQSEADQQIERKRTNYAELAAQVRASCSSSSRGRGGAKNGTTQVVLYDNHRSTNDNR